MPCPGALMISFRIVVATGRFCIFGVIDYVTKRRGDVCYHPCETRAVNVGVAAPVETRLPILGGD